MKVLLKFNLPLGDLTVFTQAVKCLKQNFPDWQINVSTWQNFLFENNYYLDRDVNEENQDKVIDVQYSSGINKQHLGFSFLDSLLLGLEEDLGVKISKTCIKPNIHLSQDEISDNFSVPELLGLNLEEIYRKPICLINQLL